MILFTRVGAIRLPKQNYIHTLPINRKAAGAVICMHMSICLSTYFTCVLERVHTGNAGSTKGAGATPRSVSASAALGLGIARPAGAPPAMPIAAGTLAIGEADGQGGIALHFQL